MNLKKTAKLTNQKEIYPTVKVALLQLGQRSLQRLQENSEELELFEQEKQEIYYEFKIKES